MITDKLPDDLEEVNETQWMLLAGWYGSEACLAVEREVRRDSEVVFGNS